MQSLESHSLSKLSASVAVNWDALVNYASQRTNKEMMTLLLCACFGVAALWYGSRTRPSKVPSDGIVKAKKILEIEDNTETELDEDNEPTDSLDDLWDMMEEDQKDETRFKLTPRARLRRSKRKISRQQQQERQEEMDSALQELREQLQERLHTLQAAESELEQRSQEVTELKEEIVATQKRLDKVDELRRSAEAEKELMYSRLQKFHQELKKHQGEKEETSKQLQQALNELKLLKGTSSSDPSIHDALSSIQAIKAEQEEIRKEAKHLRDTNKTLLQRNVSEQQQREQLLRQITSLKCQIKETSDKKNKTNEESDCAFNNNNENNSNNEAGNSTSPLLGSPLLHTSSLVSKQHVRKNSNNNRNIDGTENE